MTLTYRHNAFISYAWADNVPFSQGALGWVDTFVDRLRKHLGRELPRELRRADIWLDYEQMRGHHDISEAIRAELESSRLLVPFISKAYLDSPWCRQELEIFLHRHGPNSGRIFPVWISPELHPGQALPPVLEDLLKYPFWYEDERKRTRTRCFPEHDPTDREYSRLQQDMAQEMAAFLIDLCRHDPSCAPQVVASPSPLPVRPNGRHLVLVNGGDDDHELVQAVAQRLGNDHGIGYVLPLKPGNGLKSSLVNRDLREKLKLCTTMLVIYRNGPGHQVHQRITEFLKAAPQRPKGSPEPGLEMCIAASAASDLGFRPQQMRVHQCDHDCAAECARRLVEVLP